MVLWRECLRAIVFMGLQGLPVVIFATVSAGLVVTHEIAWHMNLALGTRDMVPGFSGQFILRELGVAIPAFLMVSRIGAALAAETGSMKITEQLDALKLMKVDLFKFLVLPRWIGCVVVSISLTLISLSITILCSLLVAVKFYDFNTIEYVTQLRRFVGFSDILKALVKSAAFGFVIPPIAFREGMKCQPSAAGVGESTTQAVVSCTMAVIVVDFVLTYLFS